MQVNILQDTSVKRPHQAHFGIQVREGKCQICICVYAVNLISFLNLQKGTYDL